MNMFRERSSIYIIGIKGVGMTAIAQVLVAQGHRVSGSDVQEHFFTDDILRSHGIRIHEGFSALNLPAHIDAVIHSTAYTRTHPEIVEAIRRNIPLYTYPEVLGELFRLHEGISVAGSHGKTTTTAMLGAILAEDGRDPTVITGSEIALFHGNARIGKSNLLCAETDEYQNKFQFYAPRHVVLTNIEYDHPDFFQTPQHYIGAFQEFFARIPKGGILVTNEDDPVSRTMIRDLQLKTITFGVAPNADVRLRDARWRHDHEMCVIEQNGKAREYHMNFPGTHNALNACAAIAFARAFGVSEKGIQEGLSKIRGIRRRFEYRGSYHGSIIYEDYAHHPTEIRAAIRTARERFPYRKLVVVFQPHTYSRTKALCSDFADALDADRIIICEVYGSAREKTKTISSRDIAAAIRSPNVTYCASIHDAAKDLQSSLTVEDCCCLLGAGDVGNIVKFLKVDI